MTQQEKQNNQTIMFYTQNGTTKIGVIKSKKTLLLEDEYSDFFIVESEGLSFNVAAENIIEIYD